MNFSDLGPLSLIRPSLSTIRSGERNTEREWIELLRRLRLLAILSVVIVEKHS